MRVTTISATIRFSQDTGKGSWKSIELGCEATLNNSSEDWEQSQRELYARLSEQLRLVWNGKADVQYSPEGRTIDVQPAKEHWCAAGALRNSGGTRKEGVSGIRIRWVVAGTMKVKACLEPAERR